MSTVAYLRVSTGEQNLDRQEELREGADKVFEDKDSGANRDRPGLVALLDWVRHGDHVRVWSIDRLARSLKDLDAIVEELKEKGVSIEFVSEHMVFDPLAPDDGVHIRRILFHILGSFAEFERSISRARQAEGIAKAKARGAYNGSKSKLTPEQVEEARTLVGQGVPLAKVAREAGVARQTLYRLFGRAS